jgi:hypothetical protein
LKLRRTAGPCIERFVCYCTSTVFAAGEINLQNRQMQLSILSIQRLSR